jgi:hypothetical protein
MRTPPALPGKGSRQTSGKHRQKCGPRSMGVEIDRSGDRHAPDRDPCATVDAVEQENRVTRHALHLFSQSRTASKYAARRGLYCRGWRLQI